jgi:hypothetical protein
MKKAASRYPVTLRGKGVFWCLPFVLRMMLPVCLLGVCVPVSWAGKAPVNRPPPTSMPLDEAISRIAAIQLKIDSLSAVRSRLRQDSATATADLSTRAQTISKRLAEINAVASQKKSSYSGMRSRYDKAVQDSAAIVAKSKEQMDRVLNEIARLDAMIVTVSNDLGALSGRRGESGKTGSDDDRASANLLAPGVQSDSLIRARQSDMMNLSARRSKLRQDSIDLETRRLNDRNRFRSQMFPLDSLSSLCDAAIRQTEQKMAGDQADRNRKIAQMKEQYSLMARQKQEFADRISRNNTDVQTSSTERQKLSQSAGATQQRYEQLRAPYDKALNAAMSEIQRCTRDKPLLEKLRKKLRLDSAIARTRDGLDKAIQISAANKKGGKKLVEQRESELDSLLAELDFVVRQTQGLRQIEAQIRGVTIHQKAAFTDSALANIDKKTAAAATKLDKARRELSAFDGKNPPVRNPAVQRIAQLDTIISMKKKESIRMTDGIDSLNMVLQDIQNSINRYSSAQAGSPEANNLIKEKKAEKVSLADKRSRIQRDSAQNDAAAANAMNRLNKDAAVLAEQSTRLQGEINRLTAERDKTKQSLAALLDKNREAKNAADAEKRKIESMYSSKEEKLNNLSAQSDKLRRDSVAVLTQLGQQINSLTPSPASLLGTLSAYSREIEGFQAQSDSLKRLMQEGQGRTNDETRKISQQIASVTNAIEDLKRAATGLNEQKKAALARLESDRRFYDSLVTTAERERDDMSSQRNKVRQDSITAEANISRAMQKVSSILKEHDITITLRQRDVNDATAGLKRVREDSVKVAERIASPPRTGGPSIQSLDSIMSIRAKELNDLQARRDKAVLDSVKEWEHLATLLSAAHNEIAKRSIALEQRKNELSLSMSVKGDSRTIDPLVRSYRDALAASTAEIQSQNDVIKRKKNDITRLRAVRDALTSATEDDGTGGSNSRLDRDKLYYDSLLSIAGQELAAIIARRDIARQDSASAQVGLKQSAQTPSPVPERGAVNMQKDVTTATAEYQRAIDDSIQISGAIPNTMQPYNQSIRTIDALITVKGKELSNLQEQLDRAGSDGSKTSKQNAGLLAAAHSEIVKWKDALEQKKNELAQATAARSTAQNEADPSMKNYQQTLEAAKLQINVHNELIGKKKDEIFRLQNVRDAINARIKQPQPAPGGESRTAVLAPKDNAQKISEDIYVMVGEGRVDDAADVFSKQHALLRANLDQESFTALKMTITEMGGKIR